MPTTTNALSLLVSANTAAQLNHIHAGIVAAVQKTGNSFRFKSKNANLSQKAGSYEFKRFVNSQSKAYGTARNAGAGDKLKAPAITVLLDAHREIVEEINEFDITRFGVDSSVLSAVSARKDNHQMTLAFDIESAFWSAAYLAACAAGNVLIGVTDTDVSPDKTIEKAVVDLETTQNDYVRGVPRVMIGGVLRPGVYSTLKSAINRMHNANFAVADEELQGVNGVALFSELYLPPKVDAVILAKESVAQPIDVREYTGDRIPLSQDIAVELFYHYGTEALAPDLIRVMITPDSTHTKVSCVTALPNSGQTDTFYVLKSDDGVKPAGSIWTYASNSWTQYNN